MRSTMLNSKLRAQIAREAARLIHVGLETDCFPAKSRAAQTVCDREVSSVDLPSNADIWRHLRQLSQENSPPTRDGSLPKMRAAAKQADSLNRFQIYEALLLPLENVRQNLKYHPEGDVLYHSLQVFDHARDELPYDEEFLTAALLHDVGKGIDIQDHVASGLEALEGTLTRRTAWLIEHHMLAHGIADRTIGSRAHRRLRESEYYDDLVLLGECDRAGRQPGVEAPELEEALDYLQELDAMCG